MRIFSMLAMILLTVACASSNCREMKEKSGEVAPPVKKENDPMNKTSAADRVKVAKPDGSLQCNQGKATPLADMQKELGAFHVYASSNRNDGMMRIQLCGAPTGNYNVYEIDRKDLAAALKLGFREWTAN